MSDEGDLEVRPLDRGTVFGEETPHTLVELVNRVLDRGVVAGGDVTISLAGVDLVYLGLNALLTSVSTARETLGRDVGRRPLPMPLPFDGGPAAAVEGPRATAVVPVRAGQSELAPPSESPTPEAETPVGDPLHAALAEVARVLPARLDVDPDAIQKDLARLVLTVVELLRRVVEHQAIRRMDDPDLSDEQVERMGLALQRLEEKLSEIKGVFGLADDDLDVDLGPLGKLY